MPAKKLTQKTIDALKPGSPATIRDAEVKGLLVRVSKSTVAYAIQRELWRGERRARTFVRTIRMTIGHADQIKLDAARTRARELLAEIARGVDPAEAKAAPEAAWTLQRGYDEYLEGRPADDYHVRDMRARLARYLPDWAPLPMADLTRELVKARHAKVRDDIKQAARSARATGTKTANAVLKDIRSVWAFVAEIAPLPIDPTRKIALFGETKAHHDVPISDLQKWWAATAALPNPLRRSMHRLGLLSGLRPGNLMGCRREWLRLDELRIDFPASAMKNGEAFTLPLSGAMVELIREALAAGDVLYPGTPWLFPARTRTGATVVIREKSAALKDATGHALRHTWKTCARLARLSEVSIEVLLAHRQRGVVGAYGSLAEQFDRWLADQELVTTFILSKVKTQ